MHIPLPQRPQCLQVVVNSLQWQNHAQLLPAFLTTRNQLLFTQNISLSFLQYFPFDNHFNSDQAILSCVWHCIMFSISIWMSQQSNLNTNTKAHTARIRIVWKQDSYPRLFHPNLNIFTKVFKYLTVKGILGSGACLTREVLPYCNKGPLLGKTPFWNPLQLHSGPGHRSSSASLCCTAEGQHWWHHQWTQNSEFLLQSRRNFSSKAAALSSRRFYSLG